MFEVRGHANLTVAFPPAKVKLLFWNSDDKRLPFRFIGAGAAETVVAR